RHLPHFAVGRVVKGFGRGSKELGIPTANFPADVVEHLPEDFQTGIYCGWARVANGPIYKMVMSVGWNPYYHNTQKSMETHIIHEFPADFYEAILRVGIVAFLRPEANFSSLDDLIKAIKKDIQDAEALLDSEKYLQIKEDPFLKDHRC
ncbi:unnamed protein product, partial [Darwinula stevensoni]